MSEAVRKLRDGKLSRQERDRNIKDWLASDKVKDAKLRVINGSASDRDTSRMGRSAGEVWREEARIEEVK